eukprot:gene2579-biopygen12950
MDPGVVATAYGGKGDSEINAMPKYAQEELRQLAQASRVAIVCRRVKRSAKNTLRAPLVECTTLDEVRAFLPPVKWPGRKAGRAAPPPAAKGSQNRASVMGADRAAAPQRPPGTARPVPPAPLAPVVAPPQQRPRPSPQPPVSPPVPPPQRRVKVPAAAPPRARPPAAAPSPPQASTPAAAPAGAPRAVALRRALEKTGREGEE